MGTISIGGQTFNIFGASLLAANQFFFGRLASTAWSDASGDDQGKALVTAAEQMLAVGLCDPDSGADIDTTTTETDVIKGSYELALALLEDTSRANDPRAGDNLKAAGAGSARVEFFAPTLGKSGEDTVFPPNAMRYLSRFLKTRNAGGGGDIVAAESFGTDGTSKFDPCGSSKLTDFLP